MIGAFFWFFNDIILGITSQGYQSPATTRLYLGSLFVHYARA